VFWHDKDNLNSNHLFFLVFGGSDESEIKIIIPNGSNEIHLISNAHVKGPRKNVPKK